MVLLTQEGSEHPAVPQALITHPQLAEVERCGRSRDANRTRALQERWEGSLKLKCQMRS